MRGFCLSGNFAMKAEKKVFFSEDFVAIVTEKVN